jgi:hypothetical protein
MEPLTDADLSQLVTLVVIHEGESSSMNPDSAEVLEKHGMITIDGEASDWRPMHTVTPAGRARVARMLAAGRGE